MTEKDLRKLNRYQLLKLLVAQMERADKLQEQLDAAQEQLADRKINISSLGSIAEASLQLGGVFQAAQKAADLYLEAARVRASEIEEAANKKAERIIANAIDMAKTLKVIQ